MRDDPYPELRRDRERGNDDYLKTYPDKESDDVEEVEAPTQSPAGTGD
jgi:hypothetical protein